MWSEQKEEKQMHLVFELIASMNEEKPDNTTLKTENRNRNEENRRQIIGFIADNGISDAKSISKAVRLDNLYPRRKDLLYLYPLVGTVCFLKHLFQKWLVFGRCALAGIHGVDQIKVLFSVQMTFDFQIIKLLLQAPVIAAEKTMVELHNHADRKAETTARWNVTNLYIGFKHIRHLEPPFTREEYGEA